MKHTTMLDQSSPSFIPAQSDKNDLTAEEDIVVLRELAASNFMHSRTFNVKRLVINIPSGVADAAAWNALRNERI
jgi:hypothetical protein